MFTKLFLFVQEQSAVISGFMKKQFLMNISTYLKIFDKFSTWYQSNVTTNVLRKPFDRYRSYLNSLYHNNWFNFPQNIFNNSSEQRVRVPRDLLESESSFDVTADFAIFLDIEEVEAAVLWTLQFWNR